MRVSPSNLPLRQADRMSNVVFTGPWNIPNAPPVGRRPLRHIPRQQSVNITSPHNPSCPGDDGSSVAGNQTHRTFTVECYSDRVGDNIATLYLDSFYECIQSCDATPNCVDVSWVNSARGPCYLKAHVYPVVQNTMIYGAIRNLAMQGQGNSSTIIGKLPHHGPFSNTTSNTTVALSSTSNPTPSTTTSPITTPVTSSAFPSDTEPASSTMFPSGFRWGVHDGSYVDQVLIDKTTKHFCNSKGECGTTYISTTCNADAV